MKKITLLFLLSLSVTNYAQCLSKVQLIFEDTNLAIMNNGEKYEVSSVKPFYRINDPSISRYISVKDKVLRVNRVLLLKKNKSTKRLVEWTKENHSYYEYRELDSPSPKRVSVVISVIKNRNN